MAAHAAAGRGGAWQGWTADRARLFAVLAILDALNALWPGFARSWAHGLGGFVLGAGGISAMVWFALFAVWSIGGESAAPRPASRANLAFGALMLIAAMLPSPLAASLALSAAAIYLIAIGTAGGQERRIGIVLLALGNTLLWGKLLLRVAAPGPLLRLDAALVSLLSGLPSTDNMLSFSDKGRFYVAPGCSSLHNISLAVLLWASATQLLGLRMTPRLIATCAAAMVTMLLVNASRLTAIGYFHADFHFLHEGAGKDLFGLASLVACGAVIAIGIRSEARNAA